jgi:hypothetical protein
VGGLLGADEVASFVVGVHLNEAVFEIDHCGLEVGQQLDYGIG